MIFDITIIIVLGHRKLFQYETMGLVDKYSVFWLLHWRTIPVSLFSLPILFTKTQQY